MIWMIRTIPVMKGLGPMNGCHKVRACCSHRDCAYVQHNDVIRTINHQSSFSFCMMMNERNESGIGERCPKCGRPLLFYPVSCAVEPAAFE